MKYLSEYKKQKKRFEEWLIKQKLTALSPFKNDCIQLIPLLNLCIDDRKDNRSLHAIWLLEKYMNAFPEDAEYILPKLIAVINNIHREGSQRIAGNIIIAGFGNRTAYVYSIEEQEKLIEVFFNWLITPNKAVAVIANCFDVLCYLSHKQPWIKDELSAQIKISLKNGSAAVQSRGRKVLHKLNKS